MFGEEMGHEFGWHEALRHLRAAGRGGHRHGGHRHGGHRGPGGPGFPPGPPGFPPFPPFPHGFPFGFGRRARVKRGDVRAGILILLGEAPRNGYQIIQELEQRSGGAWRPSPGSVYPALQQLEDEGLVQQTPSGTGRIFELTDAGREYVKSHSDELPPPWEAVSEAADASGARELMGLARQVMGAAVQVLQAGDASQVQQAKKLLGETRRALYRLLAEDGPDDED